MPRKDCAGDALKMQKSRSGAVESCATASRKQQRGLRCGRKRSIEAEKEFSAAPAPQAAAHKTNAARFGRGGAANLQTARQGSSRIPTNISLDPPSQAARSDDGTNDQLLTPAEAAAYLRVSKSYLDKLRVYGGGPKFVRPGKRKIIYRKPHLDVWAAERTFTSTSEYDDPAKDQSD
jgi:hypothetical protein